jgi:dipeptidyl aminopeptidase/acylaminoacyl peptidase
MKIRSCPMIVVLILVICISAVAQIQELTPILRVTPDDFISRLRIDGVTISPDHSMVAYVLWEPTASAVGYEHFTIDVWVRPIAPTAQPVDITNGGSKLNYFAPLWSPDGSRLAMVFLDEAGDYHPAIWDKATRQLTRFDAIRIRNYPDMPRLSWVDNEQLILSVTDRHNIDQPFGWLLTTYAERAYRGAVRAKEGKRTATVFESGIPLDASKLPQESVALMRLDGRLQMLGSGSTLSDISVSPDQRYVAFLKQTSKRPLDGDTVMTSDWWALGPFGGAFSAEIVDMAGKVVPFQEGSAQYIKPRTLKWSPDSKSLALMATAKDDPVITHIYRGSVGETLSEIQLGAGITPKSFVWTNAGLLVAGEHAVGDRAAGTRRLDWWLVTSAGTSRLVTDDLKAVPASLSQIGAGSVLIGIAEGDVWRYDVEKSFWTNLTASFTPRVSNVSALEANVLQPRIAAPSTRDVLVTVGGSSNIEFYSLDLGSGTIRTVKRPSAMARPVAYDGAADVAVFLAVENTGTYLTVEQHGRVEPILMVNQNLRQLALGQPRLITYRSLDGQQLKAWLLLPPDYKQGKRYPLVAYVYAGSEFGDTPPVAMTIDEGALQLLAARGYAVLMPSMPLAPDEQVQDVYMELAKGVLPAVDEVISMGIADPKRLAVDGWSFGGYSVFGLVTQTTRFQAAIAGAGISDLISGWGTHSRLGRDPGLSRVELPMMGRVGWEWSQEHLGNPPWKDAARYVRNSPIFYADRMETPLLIVHGDLDSNIPIEQSEEFFTAMVRQGKRARFVRYVGEEHDFSSPANIRDFWMQTYAWLDEFCDIARDEKGNLIFDGDHVKSRNGAPALTPEDFARFNELELRSHPWITHNTEAPLSVAK